MAEITAQAVNEFRKRTGLGLMECKKLLQEAGGEMAKAETLAKERGMAKAAGRAGRTASAGRVEVAISDDGRVGAMVELNCETDFVARNDDFRKAAATLADLVLQGSGTGPIDVAGLSGQAVGGAGKSLSDFLLDLNSRTGENVQFTRAARLSLDGPGRVDAYVHHDNKSGAMVSLRCPDDATAGSEAVIALAKDLALQVVATRPIAARREEVSADAVAEQKRIFVAQAEDKPENIREKIAEGKLNSWYGEIVLVDQVFVKDPSNKVSDVIKATGPGIELGHFARLAVGEAPE
ncbi:translation elongation factor Ts [Tautonia plasticadhaerens]|uniref:Elongation factor Ts n=1 Tax=Tautonia plasticadhaerens TaxID=2527974 RepID=A0A518H701_9BACT|nr:translation elongation factor Ts [Tautonia plasticadhaerens]QDV36635.1 Elongation factor Ts [Tautonia plasticadhaerens]